MPAATVKLKCWSCGEEFHIRVDVEEKPDILVECPECDKECFCKFGEHKSEIMSLLKDGRAIKSGQAVVLDKVFATSLVNC
ncbi:MAG: hypothetical protein GY862_03935 [Gammaproteobacteria bacterium]|nr:hypothetical protein [Gammaproteobacteria bacterium]